MKQELANIERGLAQVRPSVLALQAELGKAVIGQGEMLQGLLIGLFSRGHVLLEGLPGLAKTRAVSRLAQCLGLDFSRIQFTPDMLPADLIGTQVFNPKEAVFTAEKGPLFSHLVLADEINRAPAKVQSALLEVMQEKQITLAKTTYRLEDPFLVLATQNPIEQEGTYALPEAQIDRFMLKLKVPYPLAQEERQILDLVETYNPAPPARQVMSREQVLAVAQVLDQIYVAPQIKDYIVSLVQAARQPGLAGLPELQPLLEFGPSPRGGIACLIAAKALALFANQAFVTPELVKQAALPCLRHRVLMSFEAEAEGVDSDQYLTRLLERVPLP